MLKNNTFCAAPWTVYNVNADGTVGICCLKHDIKDSVGNHADFVRSNAVVEIKSKMIAGEPVQGCEKCYLAEENNAWSLRKWYNRLTADSLDESRLSDPEYENRSWFDLSLSNKCNQKCRICGPYNSTAWTKDAAALADMRWNHTRWNSDKTLIDSSNDIPKILDSMSQSTSDLYVELKGGEPLYLESSKQLLSGMIARGLHERTAELRIITNGTAYESALLDLLRQFPALDIGLSIDATGKLHEYTRGTSISWDDCRRSWERISQLPNLKKLRISNTIYAYTVWDLHNLRSWAAREFGNDCQLADAVLHKPRYMHLKILPQDMLDDAACLLDDTDKMAQYFRSPTEISDVSDSSAGDLATVLARHRQRFVEFTKRLDQQRNEKLLELVPQLQRLFAI